MYNKNKHREEFTNTVELINKNNLFKETDYYVTNTLIKKIVARDKNYVLIGDLKSSYNMKTMRRVAKTVQKFDKDLVSFQTSQLDEIMEHFDTINMLISRIDEVIKNGEKNEDEDETF